MQPTLLGVAVAGRLLRLRGTRRGQELGRRREDSITSKKRRTTNAGSPALTTFRRASRPLPVAELR
jgi:hypothetical protein